MTQYLILNVKTFKIFKKKTYLNKKKKLAKTKKINKRF